MNVINFPLCLRNFFGKLWLPRRRSEREYAKYGGSHGRITGRNLVAPTPAWCGGSRGPRMAHEAGDSLPLWLATLICIATCYTGATATGARLLDLHRSFSHQTSHTIQPPSFRAAATTACVAARAAMPNSEEGSVVCCVPSCPD